jgi:hypothetical protein
MPDFSSRAAHLGNLSRMRNEKASSFEGLKPVRLRGLVKGASSSVWVAPPGGSRTDQTFAWWLEVLLNSAGLPAQIRNAGSEGQKITQALCDWETEIQQWSPDVVVLNYAQYECMPGMLPRWLERHATGWHRHSGPIRNRYRQKVLNPTWRRLTRLQRRADELNLPRPFRSSTGKTILELERLVEQIQLAANPLVFVMDTWPIAPRWQKWFPKMSERISELGEAMTSWAKESSDPNLRLFRLSEIVAGHDLEEALPDGVHFSAELHREIASELAREILPWAATQPHLRHPEMDVTKFG